MTTYLGKSFSLVCRMFFLYTFVFSPFFGFEGSMWDLNALVGVHCFKIVFLNHTFFYSCPNICSRLL